MASSRGRRDTEINRTLGLGITNETAEEAGGLIDEDVIYRFGGSVKENTELSSIDNSIPFGFSVL